MGGLRLADLLKVAHRSACPCIPSSSPPTVPPLSSSCSQSGALVYSQAGSLPQRSLKGYCASSVRHPNVSAATSSGPQALETRETAEGRQARQQAQGC
jgi:hypothetical protein